MKLILKKTSGVIAIAGALMLLLAIVAFSQGPHGPRGGFHGGPGGPHDGLGPIGRDLDLTDEQKAQIKKIQDSFAENVKGLHDQLRALHASEPDPLSGEAFNEAAVRSAAEARAKVQVELEVTHARMMSQVFGILTQEQRAKLASRRQEFEQRHREGRPGPPEVGPEN